MSKPPNKRRIDKSQFIEGHDAYRAEYNWWLTNASRVLKTPLEVFMLDADRFHESSLEEKLAIAGHPEYVPLYYNVDVDNSNAGKDRSSFGTGVAFAARDHFGKVRPFICIRDNSNTPLAEDPIADGHIDLLVLLHELGHADDIAKSLNYDHENRQLGLVNAELYAHEFAVRNAQKFGYRVLCGYYLDNIEHWRASNDDSLRLPAEKFCERNPLEELRKAIGPRSKSELRRFIKAAGREREFPGIAGT